MGLERTFTNKVLYTSFRTGWGEFCATNDLNVDDTYFFNVIHEAIYSIDKEWEEEQEDDEANLRVEVRMMNGRWRR
jgi:hypothetical protein